MNDYFSSGWFARNRVHPLFALLFGVAASFSFLLAFTQLGAFLSPFLFGVSVSALRETDFGSPSDPRIIHALKFIQGFSQVGGFGITVLWVASLCDTRPFDYVGMSRPFYPRMSALALASFALLIPFVLWLSDYNSRVTLPAGWSAVEKIMRDAEAYQEKIEKIFLTGHSVSGIGINFLIMAVIPAVAEELLFRGFIQRTLTLVLKPLTAVCVTAFIFSAFHFSFYGFFPRFILGFFLGLLFQWSGSLWVSASAHFANNAFMLVLYYLSEAGASASGGGLPDPIPWTWAAVSLVSSAAILAAIKKYFSKLHPANNLPSRKNEQNL